MIVAVHCGLPPAAGRLAGRIQPLILSSPLWVAHHAAAALSASARVAAVNARQYLAFFNIWNATFSPLPHYNSPPGATSPKAGLPTSNGLPVSRQLLPAGETGLVVSPGHSQVRPTSHPFALVRSVAGAASVPA